MTKAQRKTLFEKIDRGVKSGALTVIETAERTNTKILVSCPKGEIKELSPAQAKRVLKKREDACLKENNS
ncbi:MAG: hypothetical protein JXR30_04010 [Alphaproteobacteria bacterium]|nr:hypothetical protein [Alphaproteobacteria bacterium]